MLLLLPLLFIMTYDEVLDYLWTPPRLLIYLRQHLQYIYHTELIQSAYNCTTHRDISNDCEFIYVKILWWEVC